MSRYALLPLLRVDVTHGYFADGRCRGLRFLPTGSTAHRLQRAGVWARQDGATLLLVGPADAADQLRGGATAALGWQVVATDERFASYTDDPARRPGELLLVGTALAVGAARDGDAGDDLPEPLRVRPVSLHRRIVMQALSVRDRARPPFALLRIGPDRLRPRAAFPDQPRRLGWTLAPRATVWKYCLFGDWPEDALDVFDPAGRIDFQPPARERLDDGRPLLALRSRRPLELAEQAAARLQLRCRSGDIVRVLVKRLPVAGPQHLAREEIDGAATLVSEIHVHR